MESFNNSSNNKRPISLGMPPLPPTNQRMEGQTSQNPNIVPKKRKRTLASRQHGEIFRPEEIAQMMQLEWTVKSLEANVGRDFALGYYWKQEHYSVQDENEELKRKLDYFTQKMESKKAEFVQLMREKDKLNVYGELPQNDEEVLVKWNIANALIMHMNQPGLPTSNSM